MPAPIITTGGGGSNNPASTQLISRGTSYTIPAGKYARIIPDLKMGSLVINNKNLMTVNTTGIFINLATFDFNSNTPQAETVVYTITADTRGKCRLGFERYNQNGDSVTHRLRKGSIAGSVVFSRTSTSATDGYRYGFADLDIGDVITRASAPGGGSTAFMRLSIDLMPDTSVSNKYFWAKTGDVVSIGSQMTAGLTLTGTFAGNYLVSSTGSDNIYIEEFNL